VSALPGPAVRARARELSEQRRPFVHARVVRAQVPTSAHAGDEAIVHPDGRVDGFVGGVCAEGSVRTAALGALRDGEALLLRVLPEGSPDFPDLPGSQVVVNPCLSGGALEIFLEPVVPPPLVEIVGSTPVASALRAHAELLGYAVSGTLPGTLTDGTSAVVVASHGRDEEESLRAALDADVPYVALVAGPRRGAAVLDGLGVDAERRARVHTPAGLDIGARTAPEVALSIMAELVAELRRRPAPGAVPGGSEVPSGAAGDSRAAAGDPPPLTVTDPVCGMTVTVVPDTPHLAVDGTDHWFCCTHCRDRYTEGLVA
jgi:xanthine dehydrogenase accessory factor